MGKSILVGTVTLDHETVMENYSFQYAASFEKLSVPAGTYPIVCDHTNYDRKDRTALSGFCYMLFKGTCLAGNVGTKVGDPTYYAAHIYDYELARKFIDGSKFSYPTRYTYELRPEWEIELEDIVYNGKRIFGFDIVLKDGETIHYEE